MKQKLGKKKAVHSTATPCTVVDIKDLKVHESLQKYLSYCLYKTSQKLRFRINEALKDYNLVGAHIGILAIIDSSPPLSQIALGEELGFDKATMVKLLDSLEANGFIERVNDTKDRRIKIIKITKSGKKFADKMNIERTEIEKQFLSILTPDEEKMFRSILPKLLFNK